jgi:[ribosomal protein S18]-alanine N-acetyltransferase
MQAFSVEEITASDIGELLEIADECGLGPWSRQNFADELARDDSILLLSRIESGKVIGFLVGRVIAGSAEGEINNIAVTPEFRRRGLGKLLLDEFLKRCIRGGVDKIWLEVRSLNASAIAFYKRYGFQRRSTRKNFYSNPVDDALVMELDISME